MKKTAFLMMAFLLCTGAAVARVPEGDLLEGVKPGKDGGIDVITVFAHQDDESFYGGGTLFILKEDPRVRLHILCMTLGDKSGAKDRLDISEERLGRIRTEELESAAAVYEAEQVIMLGYHDQGLTSADHEELVEKVAGWIEKAGAEVVITHDPSGITRHQDHMETSRAATEAFKETGAQKLYYVTLHGSLGALSRVLALTKDAPDPVKPDFRVDVRKYKKLKRLALLEHASQIHFSEVGNACALVRLLNHEYFKLADENR